MDCRWPCRLLSISDVAAVEVERYCLYFRPFSQLHSHRGEGSLNNREKKRKKFKTQNDGWM